MHGFTHLLISRRNMALSVVDSVLEVFFSGYPALTFIRG